MSRIVRLLAWVIGAKWFFPISFIAGMIAGVDLSSHFDARHVEKGDQPHSAFYVVWQPGEAGEPFGYSTLKNLPENQNPGLPAPSLCSNRPAASDRTNSPAFPTKCFRLGNRNNSSRSCTTTPMAPGVVIGPRARGLRLCMPEL